MHASLYVDLEQLGLDELPLIADHRDGVRAGQQIARRELAELVDGQDQLLPRREHVDLDPALFRPFGEQHPPDDRTSLREREFAEVETPVARLIVAGKLPDGGSVRVDVVGDALRVEPVS